MTSSNRGTDHNASVGSVLRRARQRMRWTLVEAAARSGSGFKPSTIAAYERGERRITTAVLYRFAELYEMPVRRLLPPTGTVDDERPSLTEQISDLPRPHRELLTALVQLMVRDTTPEAPPAG